MKQRNKEKKLLLTKVTIQNLNIKKTDVLGKDEQKVVNGGSDKTIPVGVTEHPKYC